MNVNGDAWEIERVRHSYAQASGQGDKDELRHGCQRVLRKRLWCAELTRLYMSS